MKLIIIPVASNGLFFTKSEAAIADANDAVVANMVILLAFWIICLSSSVITVVGCLVFRVDIDI